MNHKERLIGALNHKVTDRVPIDFGSTPVTGLHYDAYINLRKYLNLGLDIEKIFFTSKMQQSVMPEEEILQKFDVDVRGIYLSKPNKSLDADFEDGSWQDMWGVLRKIPKSGSYYEIVNSPFQNKDLSIRNINDFEWPDCNDEGFYNGIFERAKELYEKDYGAILIIGGSVVHISQFMRGFENWYMDLILNPKLIQEIMHIIVEFYIGVMKKAFYKLGKFGKTIDAVYFADDLGTQESPQISPDLYRNLIKPFHKRMYSFIRNEIGSNVFLHSCGAIYPLINDLIDAGVTILNPIQVSAKNMDISKLKNDFGDKLIFWGGIDTTKLLPSGSKNDVKNAVKKTVEILGKNGGYVLSASHNIQTDIPPENILELYKAIKY
ncbi:MAG: hypothetical protein M1479_09470 [Actinobacteria bacterium]|nr:hypothetical protein [Cyanobacteriota bacterium]MCL5772482.1 hypothetical protein [Actinomycetota bacterium]